MTGSPLRVTREDQLLRLELNRPDNANALSPELVEALLAALSDSRGVRLCVIEGAGKHFCAGFDLSDLASLSDGDLLWRFVRIETLLQAVHHAPFPTLALAQGQAVGAGADLFAACWQRVAAPETRFRMPGWNFGIALGTQRLARRVGADSARDLLVDTRVMSAESGVSCGLVSAVLPMDDWEPHVASLLERCSALPEIALQDMLALTVTDTRAEDMAALVRTAGRPGLTARVAAYRERVQAARKQQR